MWLLAALALRRMVLVCWVLGKRWVFAGGGKLEVAVAALSGAVGLGGRFGDGQTSAVAALFVVVPGQ